MMKSVALSESCLYPTAAEDDFVIVEASLAPHVSPHPIRNKCNSCFFEADDVAPENENEDDDASSFDYCDDAFCSQQVGQEFSLLIERGSNSNDYSSNKQFLTTTATDRPRLGSTSMTSSFFFAGIAEMVKMAKMTEPFRGASCHSHYALQQIKPMNDSDCQRDRQSSVDEQRQSDSQNCYGSDAVSSVCSQTGLAGSTTTHTEYLASLPSDGSSSDEEAKTSVLESTTDDSDTGSDGSSQRRGPANSASTPGGTAVESPALPMSKQQADATVDDSPCGSTTIKFKRLSNKKRRRQLRLARKAAAASLLATITLPQSISNTTITTPPIRSNTNALRSHAMKAI
jgi:hypothetical protein